MPALRSTLRGVRAFVLDADGVLLFRGAPIAGAAEAVGELRRRGVPYRVVTNYSSAHRSSLAAGFAKATGLEVDGAEIITAASAAASYTAKHQPGARLLVLAAPDARREWDGQHVVTPAEAEAGSEPVAAVVIGDAGDELSFGNLDIAFRQLRAGAAFVAMHRNPWWLTPKGYTLDAGAAVAGLEFALGRKAVICGKPSPVVFRQALAELRAQLAGGPRPAGHAQPHGSGGARLRAADVVMVGDDPSADIAAARRAGLRGVLVLTGKTSAATARAAGLAAGSVAADLRAVVAAAG
ncbi:MAG TPA: HAD-IIA family hydrolase [Candidatus Limnocylindrales bacterium]|jgi:HAD superfamily hydrolase (TIGR01450 family)|nr:HAD-IIA family hydrolase [Candidatus Limnocylindrales bacterium]